MKIEKLIEIIGAEFYTGVPDSQLKTLCDYLMAVYGIDSRHHIIAANEGNCTALAAGYHLSTGKVPVVYLQNSGEGNIINPVASLLNEKIYAIPVVFIIGWRGEPGVHDEPQHIHQGEVTLKLLEDMGIAFFVIGKETTDDEVEDKMIEFSSLLSSGKDVAFVIQKGALTDGPKIEYSNLNSMSREEVIKHIVAVSGDDPIISTTGKTSRELFEIRSTNGQSHEYDFLTVGSMGHASSIALGVALNKPDRRIWCIDGDGAILMHMGALAVIGMYKPKNLIHVVINNGAHESVGGMPTVAGSIDITTIAKACGYENTLSVNNLKDLDKELEVLISRNELSLIEVKCSIGAREDLGRPTILPIENKKKFMGLLSSKNNGRFGI